MKLLTNEQQKSYQKSKLYYICREKFEEKHFTAKKHCKFWYHCHYTAEHRGAAHSVCILKYSIPKKNSNSFLQWV